MMNLFSSKKEIIEVGKRMYQRGYVASNDGNISARIDENKILITPTGVSKGFMRPEDLIVIDFNGNVISGTKKPSSEFLMHAQVYKNRPDVMCVSHAHPPYATGFGVAGLSLEDCVLPEVVVSLGGIPLVEYGTPGTEELSKRLVPFLKNHDAFILANHGVLTLGKDIINAYHKMETVEHFAYIAFIARQLGSVNKLNKEQVSKLEELRKNFGITTTAKCKECSEGENQNSEKFSEKIDHVQIDLVKKLSHEISKLNLGK